MSTTIDERVVQMQFDNKDFEKGVSATLQSIDKLEQALKFEGSSKGIEELQKSFNNFDTKIAGSQIETLAKKFNDLGIIGTTVLTKIASKAVDAGEKIFKALTVDNIKAGWNKFAEDTRNIGTIIAQGFSMADTEEEMKRLMFFTDETSYSYTDMVNNISKFTAAGKDLHDSVDAMQGIALWAASAGVNAQKASAAMYQLSQAIGGYMRKEDWKSMQTLNMDTKEFRQVALDAGVAMGRLTKTADGMYQSVLNPKAGKFNINQFVDHLTQDKWFDSEVQMAVYQRYNEAVQAIYDYVQKHNVSALEAMKALENELDPLALKWFKSAQEARTFGDAIEYVKEALATGWMNTFKIIFGNYKDATKLWSNLAEVLYEVIVRHGEVRNSILEIWKAIGGREYLLMAFSEAFKTLSSVLSPAKDALASFFPLLDESTGLKQWAIALKDVTEKVLDFFVSMRLSDSATKALTDVFRGLFTIVKMAGSALATFIHIISPLGKPLNIIAGYILQLAAYFGRLIVALDEFIGGSARIKEFADGLADAFSKAAYYITLVANAIAILLTMAFETVTSAFKSFTGYIKQIPILGTAFTNVGHVLKDVVGPALAPFLAALGTIIVAAQPVIAAIGAIAATAATIAGAVGSAIAAVSAAAPVVAAATAFYALIRGIMVVVANAPKYIEVIIAKAKALYDVISKYVSLDGVRKGFNFAKSSIIDAYKSAKKFFNYKNKNSGINKAIANVSEGFDGIRSKIWGIMPEMGGVKAGIANFFSGIADSIKSIKSFDDLKQKIGDFLTKFVNIQTISNGVRAFANGLLDLVNTVLPKFGTFGTTIANGINTLVQAISSMRLDFSFSGILNGIATGFKLFAGAIATILSKLVPKLKEGFDAIKGFFSGLSDKGAFSIPKATILDAFSSLLDGFDKVRERSGIAAVSIGALFDGLVMRMSSLKTSIDAFLKEKGLDVVIANIMSFLRTVTEGLKSLKPSEVLLFAFGIAVTKFAVSFSDAITKITVRTADLLGSVKALTDKATSVMQSVGNAMDSLAASFKKLPQTLEKGFKDIVKAIKGHNFAKDMLRMAAAIALLAGSIYLLTRVEDPKKLIAATVAIGAMVVALTFAAERLGKIDAGGIVSKAAAFFSISLAVIMLAGALALFSHVGIENIAPGMLALAVTVYGLVKALEYLSVFSAGSMKVIPTLIALAFALDLITLALVPLMLAMKFVDPASVGAAIFVIATFMAGLAGLSRATIGINPGAAVAVLGIVASLYLLVGAIKLIAASKIDANLIMNNLDSFAIIIGAVFLVLLAAQRLGTAMQGFGVAIAGIAAGAYMLTFTVSALQKIKFRGLTNLLVTLGTFWFILWALYSLMTVSQQVSKATVGGAVSLLIIAAAVRVLALTVEAMADLTQKVSEINMANALIALIIITGMMAVLMKASEATRYAKLAPIVVLIGAIGLMMIAVTLISRLPRLGGLVAVAAGLGVFFAGVGYAFSEIAKASEKASPAVMVAFMVIVAALVGALVYLSQQDWKSVAAAGGAIAGAAIMVGLALYLIARAASNAQGAAKGAATIILASLALVPAAFALSLLADYDWKSILAAGVALGVLMVMLATGASVASSAVVGAAALVVASLSLVAAAASVGLLAKFEPEKVLAAAVALGILMVMLGAAALVATPAILGAAAMVVASVSLVIASVSLSMLANFDPGRVLISAISLGMLMVFLAASALVATPAIIGAAALVVASASLVIASLSIAMLASFDPTRVVASAVALGAMMVVLAAMGLISTGAIVGALALNVAALSLVTAAIALSVIATLPMDQVVTGVLGLIAVMGALVLAGVLTSLPPIAFGLGVFSTALVALSAAFLIISVSSVLFAKAVATIVAAIVAIGSLSEDSITRIRDNLISLGSALGESMAAVIQGFLLSMAAFVAAAVAGIMSSLSSGFAEIVALRDKFAQAAANIGAGIVQGLSAAWDGIRQAVSNMANGIIDTFKDILGIHSPSLIARIIGFFFGEGMMEGLDGSTDGVTTSASSMANAVKNTVGSTLSADAGAGIMSNFCSGLDSKLNGWFTSFKARMHEAGLAAQGALGNAEAKAEANKLKTERQKKAEREAWSRAAVLDQEKLEKEMGWNKKKDPFEDLIGNLGSGLGGAGGGGGGGGGGGASEAAKETAKEIDKLTNIMDYASNEVMRFKKEWAETEHGLSDTQALSASKDALELLALQLYENSIASETAEEAAERMGKTQEEVAADIKQAYLDMKKGVQETLKGQIDMFKMFDFGDTATAEDMLGRAESARNAALDYGESITKLGQKVAGIRGGEKVLQHFVDEGATSLGDLKGVLAMSSEQLEKYLSLFEDMPNLLDYATESAVSSVAYVGYRAAGGFAEGLNPEEGAAAADNFSVAILDKLRERFGVNLQGDGVSTVTKSIGEGIAKGITTSLDGTAETKKATTQSEQLGSDISTAINDKATDGSYEIGKNICEGIAKGISDNASTAINAAIDMAVSALEGAKDALGINSPSKAFEDIGFYSDQGLANGLFKYGSIVREAAADTAYGAVDELSGVFGHIADLVDGSLELDPTIRPVLDLTNLANGNTAISSMLGLNDPYALNAAYAGIQNDGAMIADLTASFNRAIDKLNPENGETRDIVIHIYPTENQNPEDIANAVSYKINHEVLKKSAARGGAS